MRRQHLITEWHDREVSGGKPFAQEIDSHLESAKIILLLVSADFLASDYCWGIEVERAMERHRLEKARVIPVILRPTVWQEAPFGDLQALPRDAKPITSWTNKDEALENVVIGIRKAIEEMVEISSPSISNQQVNLVMGKEPAPAVTPQQPILPPPSTEEEAAQRIRSGLFHSAEQIDLASRILQAFEQGGPEAARAEVEEIFTHIDDFTASTLAMTAGIVNQIGLPDLTVRLFLEASEKEPSNPLFRRELVVALSSLDQDDLALPFARRLVAEYPDNLDYVELLAQVLQSAGYNDEAWTVSNEALQQFPASTWLLGFALESGREVGRPMQDLDELATRFISQEFTGQDAAQDLARARALYANFLAKVDRDKESVEEYRKALEAGEMSPATRSNFAVELAAIGDDQEAEREFMTALREATDSRMHSRIKNRYVTFLLARGRTTDATQASQQTWTPS